MTSITISKVVRNMPDRRRAEIERGRAVRELKRLLIAERKARVRAERSNRFKHHAVALVAHELKAPLHAVLGWTELMLANKHDEQLLARGLEVVARNSRLQRQLIADLLDTGRLTGKFRLDIQRIQLSPIVEAAVEMVQPAASAKGIAITEDFDQSIGSVDADPARLQQAFCNVLSNAVKFTPEKGHIRALLRRRASTADVVVEDDGVGIDSDFLPHVFDRFQQGDGARAGRHEGFGLGLWIVSKLVHLHGGTVSAQSAGAGQGAKFTIALPLAGCSDLREDI